MMLTYMTADEPGSGVFYGIDHLGAERTYATGAGLGGGQCTHDVSGNTAPLIWWAD